MVITLLCQNSPTQPTMLLHKVTLKSVPYYMEKEIELAFLVGLPYPEVHEERLRHGKTPKVEELKAKLCSL